MRYYIIELRGKNKTTLPDFSLLLYRLGQKIRLELRSQQLPSPFVCTDPDTGATMGRFSLQTPKSCQHQLNDVCQRFEYQFSRDITCRLQQTSNWPPQTHSPLPGMV